VGEVSCGHEAVEIVLDTYKILIEKERKLIDLANDANDVVTADMLTGYLKEQEKMVWMFVALSSHHCEK
jgi:starvation-inducible DNA-binding protein